LSAAVLALISLVFALAGAASEMDEAVADPASAEPAMCRLRIEGRAIERLTLADEHERVTAVPQPGESVSLPAGRYRVQEVDLTGGFQCAMYAAGPDEWVQLAADQTPVLKLGAPLTPQVRVKRVGRLLKLDYELVDAAGRKYVQRGVAGAVPPTFTVSKDGQTLGTGSFEYG
jgi:hypothetical protein